jgi:tetratricopeptide (TPR) repeat protein
MNHPALRAPVLSEAMQLHEAGELTAAIRLYKKAARKSPRDPAPLNLLGFAYFQAGKLEKAAEALARSLELDGAQPDAHYNLGNVLHALGRFEDAVGRYRHALALRRDYAEAHCNLAGSLMALERYKEAIHEFQKALTLSPAFQAAQVGLGGALQTVGRNQEALELFAKVFANKPRSVGDHLDRGIALLRLKRTGESLADFDRAIELDPGLADAYIGKGNALMVLGRFEDAERCLYKALEINPLLGNAHYTLASARRFTSDDPRLAMLERVAPQITSEADRVVLQAALAKAYTDLGQYERSLRHAAEAWQLLRSRIPYDEDCMLGQMQRCSEAFSAELMRKMDGAGDPTRQPVFIVGMPRSGTSLIEQVLASHPQVFGAGELELFGNLLNDIGDGPGPLQYPDAMPSLTAETLRELGASYVRELRALAPDAKRITDKLPGNFLYAGLIKLALPNAKFIHVRRDPLDNCVSCFTMYFLHGHAWSYDLGELGRYYRAYRALMEHWRSVLPQGAMLEVDYESAVADLEREARRIVEFCGLEWDDACLAFHKTERPVHTASVAQVRQPIYRSSIGRWEPYKEQLGPLLEALRIDFPGSE